MDSCSRVSLIEDKLPLDLVHLGLLWIPDDEGSEQETRIPKSNRSLL